ncbi:hypothetical protein [Rhodococcus opacus]|nr:hypothetical protein [Rhodococcus opacus]
MIEVLAGGAFGDVHPLCHGGDSVGEQVLESVGGVLTVSLGDDHGMPVLH